MTAVNFGKNNLAGEKSPYLLQHVDNPVTWFPWGEQAFSKAKKESKPIFLSIGYSTCHWCHVMAHESFEDAQVAELLNENFVSVKVDREERPDIDKAYMAVCQMMTGSGGWPMTIIMTPDKQPFFAGTYIPRETRFGRIGLLELIPHINQLWVKKKGEILISAGKITAALHKTKLSPSSEEPGEELIHQAYTQLSDRFDEKYGGFSMAPKFPSVSNLLFLLRYWKRTTDTKALHMVEKTLQAMRNGGIFDQIGFGFHRYSTDREWFVPHFEKMLSDQALLAIAYLETFQATGKEEYARTTREIFEYVLRDMTAIDGGFYSAEDADSEGKEGKFYLWTSCEIKQLLPQEEAEFILKVYSTEENGNFLDEGEGRNIAHLTRPLECIAYELNLAISELNNRLDIIRQKLFVYREKRTHPHKDDKILTDWNGLMIAALAMGGRVLEEPQYTIAAKSAYEFIRNNMVTDDGKLFHRFRDGEASIPAFLDDFAFLINATLELYETTYEIGYLKQALELNQRLIELFWDKQNGGFYFTATNSETILLRQKEISDGAIPSGNSIAMLNLLRLGRITADTKMDEKVAGTGRAFLKSVEQIPSAFPQLLVALDYALGPSYEIVVVGDSRAYDSREMLRAIQKKFIPNKVVIFVPAEIASAEIHRITPIARKQPSIDGKATAYICVNNYCCLPTTNIATMMSELERSSIEGISNRP